MRSASPAALPVLVVVLGMLLASPRACAQLNHAPPPLMLRPQSSSARLDEKRVQRMIVAAARWLRVTGGQLPRVLVIYDCPECLPLVRGHDQQRAFVEVSRQESGGNLYVLWYPNVPQDASLALGVSRVIDAHFGLHTSEAELIRCGTRVAAEAAATVSADDLARSR